MRRRVQPVRGDARAAFVYAVPDTISVDAAGLLEPLSVGVWGCLRAQVAASGGVDLDSMVTGHYGLKDVEAALTASRSDPTIVKAIVRPGD